MKATEEPKFWVDGQVLVSSGSAARRLSISQTALLKAARAGRIPSVETVRGRLYAERDVERFRREREGAAGEPVAA